MNSLYNFFEKVVNDNKLVQSYLIGNTKYENIKEELYKIFNKFFFKNNNNNNLDECPDLYVLKKEDGIISKDAIKNLIKNISTTSQFSNIKIYIIDECEELNDFAYNAILKTLEEPNPNIYAFLITKNIDSVRPTIVSRCQKIFISSEVKIEEFSEEVKLLSNELIELIEKENIKIISNHPELYNKISDRELFKNVLQCVQNKYVCILNNIINDNKDYDEDIELISKKIILLNNNINILNNYLNKNLAIDRFIIEMWRCNNENS